MKVEHRGHGGDTYSLLSLSREKERERKKGGSIDSKEYLKVICKGWEQKMAKRGITMNVDIFMS